MELTIERLEPNNPSFPPLLAEIPGVPHEIFVRGRMPDLKKTFVAIVGTRKATAEGKLLARSFAQSLAEHGIVVVSGLALGIDAAAHEGALAGHGETVAVLANGLDSIYPREHERLGQRILESGGCLISEYPSGTPPLPHQFLERNRIVSGLSTAVVIIEAPIHSGALATARHALDQGRDVLVVPGPTRHQNFEGSHMLLRNGARIVTSAQDILEDIGISESDPVSAAVGVAARLATLTPEAGIVFGALEDSSGGLTPDHIVETVGLPPETVNRSLALLTMEGLVEEKAGTFILSQCRQSGPQKA